MEKIDAVNLVTPRPAAKRLVNGKFYVRLTSGRFQTLRRWVSAPFIAIFFLTVWLQWNGQPLLLFSFADRHILAFGQQLSWKDLPLLAGMLIAAATLLFFLAVAYGRVWCGFACPQSIWTWLFIRIEDMVEGSASQRKKRDGKGLSAALLTRRVAKHTLWLALAFVTALTFTGYFVPIRTLLGDISSFELGFAAAAWLTIMTMLTYLNAGLVREKICLHACPYSRFQSVMFDAHTRTVTYDALRGEPRGSVRSTANTGACVDCSLCVQVCPTGIDIRDGLQAACIDCGACIDACDNVMKQLDRPTGLIRFASEQQIHQQPSPLLRPRLLGYGLVMVLSIALVIWGLVQRTTLLVEVQRDRQQLFVQLPDDSFCNDYRIKVESFEPGLEQVRLRLMSEPVANFAIHGPNPLLLNEVHAQRQTFRICTHDALPTRTALTFVFEGENVQVEKATTFLIGR